MSACLASASQRLSENGARLSFAFAALEEVGVSVVTNCLHPNIKPAELAAALKALVLSLK